MVKYYGWFITVFLNLCQVWSYDCDSIHILYNEIGCQPSAKKVNGCPKSYSCPDYTLPPETCRYKGVLYNKGERIPGTKNCNVGCHCMGEETSRGNVICAAVDCAPDLPKGKYRGFSNMDLCCPNLELYENAVNVTCQNDGRTLKEAQIFYPENTCYKCLCQPGYDNKYESPFCEKLSCETELYNAQKIAKNCAPVFSPYSKCCPNKFICDDEIGKVKLTNYTGNSKCKSKYCQFGKYRLERGYKFTVGKISCNCNVPPMVSCDESK